MSLENLATVLGDAARALGSEDVARTLETSVKLAVELIEDCDGAGVTVVRRHRRLETPASTDDWVARGDALQYELQEGPCMDAVWQHEVVISGDLATEERWPTWGRRVGVELGVRSMMCFQLFTSESTVGALNMYSREVGRFQHESDRFEGQALAAHVAVALAASQEIEGLQAALGHRTVIGQAEGILMERFDLSADRAFEVLRRVSTTSNVKLSEVAVELVHTRRLPVT
jgi:transcriptional regulator with GAF, ATPase, and Fis domain